jgi:hypothetical protein
MGFRPAGDPDGALGVRLPGRSLLVLSADARYGREHSIARRGVDFSDDGLPRKRGRRLCYVMLRYVYVMLWCPFYPRERSLCVQVAPCVSV